jgi:hypothetical protein
MSESESNEFYFEIQDESIRETLAELPYIMQVFPMYIESVQQELELHPPSNIINKEKRETLRNLYESGYKEGVIADQLDLALGTVRTLIKEEIRPLKH